MTKTRLGLSVPRTGPPATVDTQFHASAATVKGFRAERVAAFLAEAERRLGADAAGQIEILRFLAAQADKRFAVRTSCRKLAAARGVHYRNAQQQVWALMEAGLIRRDDRTDGTARQLLRYYLNVDTVLDGGPDATAPEVTA